MWATSAIFMELPKNQSPIRRKFAQSGHPATRPRRRGKIQDIGGRWNGRSRVRGPLKVSSSLVFSSLNVNGYYVCIFCV
jgi:hypothetical protein